VGKEKKDEGKVEDRKTEVGKGKKEEG